jgi:hypothetical protein
MNVYRDSPSGKLLAECKTGGGIGHGARETFGRKSSEHQTHLFTPTAFVPFLFFVGLSSKHNKGRLYLSLFSTDRICFFSSSSLFF